jgi:CRISPR-associated endonuclease/helicase Cas3
VLDEIQSYSPRIWKKIFDLIKIYSETFNIKFLITSATLPKDIKGDIVCELIENNEKYYKNLNFNKRVKLDTTNLNKKISDDEIFDLVVDKSEEYFIKNEKVLSLLMFIKKRSVSDFANQYKESFENLGYTVLTLSSNILAPRINKIINIIQNSQYKSNTKILLISTQIVEAGLDIDMDLGFKDISIIDSEIQFKGRINRNNKKNDSVLYLFNKDKKVIYKDDTRFKNNKKYDIPHYNLIQNEILDQYYGQIIKTLDETENFQNGLKDFKKFIKELKFEEITNNLVVIDDIDNEKTVYLPIKIPLEDVIMLDDFKDYTKHSHIVDNNFICGEKVWVYYNQLKNQRKYSEIYKFKKWFYLFTTTIFLPKNKENEILSKFEIHDSILKLREDELDFYSYETGFNMSIFDTNNDINNIII